MIKIGNTEVNDFKIGNEQVDSIYAGDVLLWAKNPWTPSDIATSLWYDAADSGTIVQSGGLVSQWNDKSGNGIHVSETVDLSKPKINTRTVNSLPVLDFDGDDDKLFNASSGLSLLTANITISVVFAVDNINDADINGVLSNNVTDGTRSDLYVTTGFPEARTGLGIAQNTVSHNVRMANAVPEIITVVRDFDGVNTTTSMYRNGVLVASTSGSGQQSTDRQMIYIGYLNSIRYLNGIIGEVVVTQLKDSPTRQRIEGYQAHKWGLVANLPVGHPYKVNPPIN